MHVIHLLVITLTEPVTPRLAEGQIQSCHQFCSLPPHHMPLKRPFLAVMYDKGLGINGLARVLSFTQRKHYRKFQQCL